MKAEGRWEASGEWTQGSGWAIIINLEGGMAA